MRQKWEYWTVSCKDLYLRREDVKPGSKNASYKLDPAYQWEEGKARFAWSSFGNYWTLISKCLQEMGDNHWELVGTTPLSDPTSSLVEFYFLFKRPKD